MNLVTALAIVIGLMGGIATWLVVGPLAAVGLQIWIIFIAWACFYHCGGAEAGLKNTITNMIWGAIMGMIAVLLVVNMGGGNSFVIGIIVAVTVFILIVAAQVPLISVIPAGVYGYAVTAGYALLNGPDPWGVGALGPFVYAVISIVVGAVLGFISQKIAASLAKS
jgi:hypothetical protein